MTCHVSRRGEKANKQKENLMSTDIDGALIICKPSKLLSLSQYHTSTTDLIICVRETRYTSSKIILKQDIKKCRRAEGKTI